MPRSLYEVATVEELAYLASLLLEREHTYIWGPRGRQILKAQLCGAELRNWVAIGGRPIEDCVL